MSKETLKTNLDLLRRELEDSEALDDEIRQELSAVAATIERLLEAPAPDYQTAYETLEGRALRFEASHPYFSRVLSEVTDALAKLGL